MDLLRFIKNWMKNIKFKGIKSKFVEETKFVFHSDERFVVNRRLYSNTADAENAPIKIQQSWPRG